MLQINTAVFQLQGGRAAQEDACIARAAGPSAIAIVADGVGGYGESDIASRAAVLAALDSLIVNNGPPPESLREAGQAAHEAILRMRKPMGATLSLLAISAGQAWIRSCGDSPVVLLRDGQIRHLTKGRLRWGGAGDYDRPWLDSDEEMNAIWFEPEPIQVLHGDRFLVASDGINDYLESTAAIVSRTEYVCEAALALTEDLARRIRGLPDPQLADNASGVIVTCEDPIRR